MRISPFNALLAAALALAVLTGIRAQAKSAQAEEILCDDQPRQRPGVFARVGTVSFPITCKRRDSQRYFDQGVAFLHCDASNAAERCFRQIVSSEPAVAMAYWGMAMANIAQPQRAVEFIKSAMRRRTQAGAHQRKYLDALANYFEVTPQSLLTANVIEDEDEPDPNRIKAPTFRRSRADRARHLAHLFESIFNTHSNDSEAAAFLVAQRLRNRDLGIPLSDPGAIDGLLTKILKADPQHPAHLYRMRLWLPIEPRRALGSAAASPSVTPDSAEHWHLGAEIFARCGSNRRAIRHRRAAMRIHHTRMARYQEMPFRIPGYAANLAALCADLRRVGRVHEALSLARYMVDLPRHPKFNRPVDGSSLAGRGAAALIETCREFRMLGELRQLAAQGYFDTGTDRRAAVHVTTGLASAYLDLGEVERARAMLPRITALRADVWDAATARSIDRARRQQVALLAVHERRRAAALAALKSGETSGMRPTQRSDCLVALGLGERARQTLRASGDPSFDVAIAARLLALATEPSSEGTRRLFERLRRSTVDSPLDLPLLRRLAPLAKQLGYPTDWRTPGSPNAGQPTTPADDSGLGPARWRAPIARDFELTRSNGKNHRLTRYRGKPIVVLFYLGFGCLHCVEQLRDFHPHVRAYRKAGLEILAIGTDTVKNMQQASAELPYAEKFAYTMLSDPGTGVFQQWTAFDFFAKETMHGTFLIDKAGRILFQDISHEPFNHPEWFLAECKRLLGPKKK